MKVILSGSTGYIGREVLDQCLDHPSITSILILTRRDPGDLTKANPKAKVIIVKDFTSYDEATASELRTADAAIWCLGTSTGDERVDIDFPLTFINKVIKSAAATAAKKKPFRYVQLSGALTEPPPKEGEQERSLWYFANGRRVRGATEAKVLETSETGSSQSQPEREGQFTVYLVKPGPVLPKQGAASFYLRPMKWILGDSLSVRIDELGAMMVDLAIYGNEQKIFQNREIVERGRVLLAKLERGVR